VTTMKNLPSTDPSEIGTQNGSGTFVIAEMACSHEGDPGLARTIIDAAGQAGADAIQFQIWRAKDIIAPQHADFALVERIEISRESWTELAEYSRRNYPRMQIIACVYDRDSVGFCEEQGIEAYKLHAADLSNPSLIRCVARTGKRIDLCVGASTIDEIQTAIQWIRESSKADIWLMYGYQLFPTPTAAIHLRYMKKLAALFDLPIGYQDHSDGDTDAAFWLPAAAMGMEVDILEKHVTHDRSKKGVDYQAALNPAEFRRFVGMVREIDAAKGLAAPHPFSSDETKYRKYSKKSIVAARDLPAGAWLEENDLQFLRAEELGLPPDQISRLVGRTTKRDIASCRLVREEDLL
jgi:N,N'-diacetyllegionaminate synthase